MKNDELLPCPFCGDSVKPEPYLTEGADWIIECGNCGLQMFETSKGSLIEQWNTRTEPTKEQDVCSECGGSGIAIVPIDVDGVSGFESGVCQVCTGKAPVDKIREAFDIPYQLRMIHTYTDGWLPEEKAQEIAMIGYKSQQVKIERLEKRLKSSENNEQILYTEIEFLKCCGNCKNKHKCATASGEQCEEGNWQPKENK